MILVTGSAGFLGRRVCAALRDQSHPVLGLDKAAADGQLACDLRDGEAVTQLLREHSIETVVHLAAVLRTVCISQPLLATQVNVVGSGHLFAAARETNVRRIVYGSSITVYGTVDPQCTVSEDYTPAPVDAYGGSKRFAEILGQTYQAQGGAEFVALRIPSVVGPGANSATSPWRSEIFDKIHHGAAARIEMPSAPNEKLPMTHVDDVAQAIVRLVEASVVSEMYYNSPAETISFGRLADYVTTANPQVDVTFGQAPVVGHPHAIDASRFGREFDWEGIELSQRLRVN